MLITNISQLLTLAGGPQRGKDLGQFWKYRVGDFRVIYVIMETEIRILRTGHRRDGYKREI